MYNFIYCLHVTFKIHLIPIPVYVFPYLYNNCWKNEGSVVPAMFFPIYIIIVEKMKGLLCLFQSVCNPPSTWFFYDSSQSSLYIVHIKKYNKGIQLQYWISIKPINEELKKYNKIYSWVLQYPQDLSAKILKKMLCSSCKMLNLLLRGVLWHHLLSSLACSEIQPWASFVFSLGECAGGTFRPGLWCGNVDPHPRGLTGSLLLKGGNSGE